MAPPFPTSATHLFPPVTSTFTRSWFTTRTRLPGTRILTHTTLTPVSVTTPVTHVPHRTQHTTTRLRTLSYTTHHHRLRCTPHLTPALQHAFPDYVTGGWFTLRFAFGGLRTLVTVTATATPRTDRFAFLPVRCAHTPHTIQHAHYLCATPATARRTVLPSHATLAFVSAFTHACALAFVRYHADYTLRVLEDDYNIIM